MSELVKKFFSQDLSDLEAGQLEAELQAEPESALEMAAEAERRYQSFGLPEPRLRRRVDPRKALIWGSIAFATFALVALIFGLRQEAGEAMAPMALQPDSGLSRESYEQAWEESRHSSARQPSTRKPRRPARQSYSAPGSGRSSAPQPRMSPLRRQSQRVSGGSLKVSVAMPKAGPVQVRVLDGQGRAIRQLHQGSLGAGNWEFSWDGRDSLGRAAAPGTYRIEVSRAGRVSSQIVRLNHE